MNHLLLAFGLLAVTACGQPKPQDSSTSTQPTQSSSETNSSVRLLSASRLLIPIQGEPGAETYQRNNRRSPVEEAQRRGDYAAATELEFTWTEQAGASIVGARALSQDGTSLISSASQWAFAPGEPRYTIELKPTAAVPQDLNVEIYYAHPAQNEPVTLMLNELDNFPIAAKVGDIDIQVESVERGFRSNGMANVEVSISLASSNEYRILPHLMGQTSSSRGVQSTGNRTTIDFDFELEEFSKSPVQIPVHIPLSAPIVREVDGITLVLRSLDWMPTETGDLELVATLGTPANELTIRPMSGRPLQSRASPDERRWRFTGAFGVPPTTPSRNTLRVVRSDGPIPEGMRTLTLDLFERQIETHVFEAIPLP